MKNTSRTSNDLVALTVLSLLSEQPRHPYEMQRLIRERHKDFAAGKTRSLYHAVERLVKDTLIEPVETNREGKRPERTVYRITEDGQEEFQSWLAELIEGPLPEHPLLTAAVSFLGYLPMAVALDALQSRAVSLEGHLAGMDAALRGLQTQLRLPRLVLLEHECMRALRQAELEWVCVLIRDIQDGRLVWDPSHLDKLFVTDPVGRDASPTQSHS